MLTFLIIALVTYYKTYQEQKEITNKPNILKQSYEIRDTYENIKRLANILETGIFVGFFMNNEEKIIDLLANKYESVEELHDTLYHHLQFVCICGYLKELKDKNFLFESVSETLRSKSRNKEKRLCVNAVFSTDNGLTYTYESIVLIE